MTIHMTPFYSFILVTISQCMYGVKQLPLLFQLLLTLDQNSTSLLRLTNLKHDLNTDK